MKPITLDTVRRMGLALADVEESTHRGALALKVRGKMFACEPTHSTAEPGSFGVRIDFDQRAELLAAEPDIYYITPHYLDYPMMLVRLSRVHPDALRDLLRGARQFVMQKKARKRGR
jgi:hypothetical protein